MKRIISIFLLALLIAATAAAQPTEAQMKTGLESLFGRLGTGLALDASNGLVWSDALLSGFPHFGLGLSIGAGASGKGSFGDFFKVLGSDLPSMFAALDDFGVPVPSIAGTFKIGLPFLPVDIGFAGATVPGSLGNSIGMDLGYTNFGAQLRYGLVKENFLLPDISAGLGLSYQAGKLGGMKMGSSDRPDYEKTIGPDTYQVFVTPTMTMDWTALNVDGTLQISKNFLIITPYLGIGYTVGKSTVSGSTGVSTKVMKTSTGGGSVEVDMAALNAALVSNGYAAQDYSATVTAAVSSPNSVFRVYGGLSLWFLFIITDVQVMYAPITGNVGLSTNMRFQI